MHVALNAWFWDRPDTGSGQYLRQLVKALAKIKPELQLTLIAPHVLEMGLPPGVELKQVVLHGRGHLAKVHFEQITFPRMAQQIDADLAHVPYWGAPLCSPVPIILTIHDLIPLQLPEYRGGVLARLYTALVAAAARGAAAVITDSNFSRQDILNRLALPPERVHSIPLAAGDAYQPHPDELRDSAIRRKYNLPEQGFILYLGGYDVRKNIHTLLRAYTYVHDGTAGQYPLVLAGRLPERITRRFFDVRGLIRTMALEDSVHLAGWIEEADKPALYRLASCFVFPSYYEGFGLPVLEAMACGTPIVAAQASSLPEIVGDAGFLLAPNDVRRMAGAILSILLQQEVAEELRGKGLARSDQFKWSRTATETLAIYEQVYTPLK